MIKTKKHSSRICATCLPTVQPWQQLDVSTGGQYLVIEQQILTLGYILLGSHPSLLNPWVLHPTTPCTRDTHHLWTELLTDASEKINKCFAVLTDLYKSEIR